jgi:adenosylcobinamide-GDP ribazoletransferase
MKSLLCALQFLTVIPIRLKSITDKTVVGAMVYFPVIGMFLGVILGLIFYLLARLGLPVLSIDIVVIVALVILTGAMHLDGLSDTVDALASGKPKGDMLAIMRDSHMGVMGGAGIACALLLKLAFLYSINLPGKLVPLTLMCVTGRWSLVCAMFFFPYARKEGKAKIFIEGINLKILLLSTLLASGIACFLWGPRALLILFIAASFTFIIGTLIVRQIGGLTGDVLGLINEAVEIIVLLTVSIMERVW